MLKIQIHLQGTDTAYCVPYALKGICDYYRIDVSKQQLIKLCQTDRRTGSYTEVYSKNIEQIGLKFRRIKFSYASIGRSLRQGVPVAVCYMCNDKESHFSTIVRVRKKRGLPFVTLADTMYGLIELPMEVLRFLSQSRTVGEPLWIRKVVKTS